VADPHDPFDYLLALAPPPAAPVDAGSPDRWPEIELALGTALPADYKRLINAYGIGDFGNLFFVFSPESGADGMNLLWQAGVPGSLLEDEELGRGFPPGSLLEGYQYYRRVHAPEFCPFPTFPEPGGLFPLGGDTNGGSAFWETKGRPEEWPLIFYESGFLGYERRPMPLVVFLVEWLSGRLPDSFFGVGNSPIVKRDPVFCPPGVIRPSLSAESVRAEFLRRTEEAYWRWRLTTHLGLTCDRCAAIYDGSADAEVIEVVEEAPEDYAERIGEQARREGWRVVGLLERPRILCSPCARKESPLG
jgi:hypothetical protein